MQRKTRTISILLMLMQRAVKLFSPQGRYPEPIAAPAAKKHRSLFLRHLDCGSCNGCELELQALSNPLYDIERFGIMFEASPRHADALALTGPFTRNLEQAARLTFEAMSEPRAIIAIGDCAIHQGIFKQSYAITTIPEPMAQAIVAQVPGCPPPPDAILQALLESDWQ